MNQFSDRGRPFFDSAERTVKPRTDLCQESLSQYFRFHDLRHTFASWYMMNGGDLYELAKILGHSNIKMTERYAKLARQHIARTSGTARELWKILEPQCANAANVG